VNKNFWKVPAWEVRVDKANQVELFKIPNRNIISEEDWPESFWVHIRDRHLVDGQEGQHVIRLFQDLGPGEPARCHMPPWGLAFYYNAELLFTTTLCFECSNAYVYTASGKNLRAFDVSDSHAIELLDWLKEKMPLT
jgi:hypothetical protein